MKSLADQLPPEIARQIHPEWRKNEEGYWALRDGLLPCYHGQWLAFADGAVLAAASTPLDVFLAIQQSGRYPFVIRVGHEDEPWYRIRRASFRYETTYPSAALPVVSAEFRSTIGSTGLVLDRVIPDTGADTTTLPWSDCQQLNLDPALGVPGVISGVGGGTAVTPATLPYAAGQPRLANVTALAVSADGKTLASGGLDSTVRLWDVATGKQRPDAPETGESLPAAGGCVRSRFFR